MNEESRPARRPPVDHPGKKRSGVGGQRAWSRAVAELDDEGLLLVVRAMYAVDHAVRGYRKAA